MKISIFLNPLTIVKVYYCLDVANDTFPVAARKNLSSKPARVGNGFSYYLYCMDAYNGIYYIQGKEEQPATVLLLKDKLSIGLLDDAGKPLVVYWFYDQLKKEDYWKAGKAIVHYPGYPVQTIEVPHKEFAVLLSAKVSPEKKSLWQHLSSPKLMPMYKVVFGLGIFVALIYFWLIPFLAVRAANRMPVSYEEKLGNSLYDAMKEGFAVQTERTALINEFFREMKISTPYNIRITVVDEDIANAYAMPGGHIVVHDNILAGMTRYEDLAALLSHEFTHINNKHTTKSIFRKLGSVLFLSLLFGDAGAVTSIIVSNADNLKGLSYSRSLERESDENGVKLLAERKIDCTGFVRLFEMLKKEPSVNVGEWLSSHPDLDKRIQYIKADANFNKKGVEENETLRNLFLKIKTAH